MLRGSPLPFWVAFSPFFPPSLHPAVFSCMPKQYREGGGGRSRVGLVASGELVQAR